MPMSMQRRIRECADLKIANRNCMQLEDFAIRLVLHVSLENRPQTAPQILLATTLLKELKITSIIGCSFELCPPPTVVDGLKHDISGVHTINMLYANAVFAKANDMQEIRQIIIDNSLAFSLRKSLPWNDDDKVR